VQPAATQWPTVIAESSTALDEAAYIGNRIVAKYVQNAHSVARLFEASGKPAGEVPLPGLGQVAGLEGDANDPETFFSYTDYLTPSQIYRYDVTANAANLWRKPRIDAQTDQYTTDQVFYESKDGTRVPMFITHRRGMAKDGNNPVLL